MVLTIKRSAQKKILEVLFLLQQKKLKVVSCYYDSIVVINLGGISAKKFKNFSSDF